MTRVVDGELLFSKCTPDRWGVGSLGMEGPVGAVGKEKEKVRKLRERNKLLLKL